MTNIIALNQELNTFGISLHKRTVEVLIGEIEEAIAGGLIRSKDDRYSIFDFIRVVLGDKAERKTWKRFVETDSNTVAFCHSVKFDRKDGKLANAESPATNLFGLVYLAYMSPGDYSHQLRRSSALYFVESRKTLLDSVKRSHALEIESKKIAELIDLLKDWKLRLSRQ